MLLYKLSNILLPKISKLTSNVGEYIPSIQYGRVIKIYDSGTIGITARISNVSKLYKFKIKLYGIESFKMRSKSKIERDTAIHSKCALREKILDKVVKLKIICKDNRGRYNAIVYQKSVDINNWLIEHKLVKKATKNKKYKVSVVPNP